MKNIASLGHQLLDPGIHSARAYARRSPKPLVQRQPRWDRFPISNRNSHWHAVYRILYPKFKNPQCSSIQALQVDLTVAVSNTGEGFQNAFQSPLGVFPDDPADEFLVAALKGGHQLLVLPGRPFVAFGGNQVVEA